MKKLLISVAAVVTAGALILTGCPDSSTSGGDNFVTPKCEVAASATSTIDLAYGDGNYTAGCTQLELRATDTFGQFSSTGDATFSEIDAGASDSAKAYRLNSPSAAATFAGGFIALNANYDVTGKTLKFSIRSEASGGHNMIRVYLEDASYPGGDPTGYQTEQSEGIQTFTNDGAWQEVSIDIDTAYGFSGANIAKTSIRSFGFAIVDANGGTAGFGSQVIDIDEVRFE